jgi:hypothetical protein
MLIRNFAEAVRWYISMGRGVTIKNTTSLSPLLKGELILNLQFILLLGPGRRVAAILTIIAGTAKIA